MQIPPRLCRGGICIEWSPGLWPFFSVYSRQILQTHRENPINMMFMGFSHGAPGRIWTDDLLITSELLYPWATVAWWTHCYYTPTKSICQQKFLNFCPPKKEVTASSLKPQLLQKSFRTSRWFLTGIKKKHAQILRKTYPCISCSIRRNPSAT